MRFTRAEAWPRLVMNADVARFGAPMRGAPLCCLNMLRDPRLRAPALWLVLSLGMLAGCETNHGIVVQLASNMTPGREIDVARVELSSGSTVVSSTDTPLPVDRALGRPVRIAAFDHLAEGRYTVTVTLLLRGVEVQRRRVIRDVSRVVVVTVLMTRECNGVMCPGSGDPSALECLGGRCVPPECDEEHPELCPTPDCTSDSDCMVSTIACAPRACSASGTCFARADDELCSAGSTCDPDNGCVDTLVDAAASPDAAPPRDAGIDAAPPRDAGVDAAGCSATERLLAGRCIARIPQLDFDGDGYGDLVVGASAEASNTGAAYFYRGSPTGPVLATTFRRGVGGEYVGRAVIDVHDTNGDGLDDVLVGAHTGAGGGHAYLLLGRAVPTGTAEVELGATGSSEFGQFMAGLGDIDGDAFADVAVAEDGASRAHIFRGGSSTGLPAAPGLTINPPDLARVLGPGDLNGDGRGDLVLSGAFASAEHVYVWLATAGTFASSPTTTLLCPDGASVSYGSLGAADVDGDGTMDLLVGASGVGTGALYVYRGRPGGPSATPTLRVDAPAGAPAFGAQVVGVGDLDLDGYDDVAVSSDVAAATRVHLYRGGPTGLAATPAASVLLPAGTARTSIAISAADVDGDGHPELIVGDGLLEHVYIYASPLGSPATFTFDLSEPSATRFGSAVTAR